MTPGCIFRSLWFCVSFHNPANVPCPSSLSLVSLPQSRSPRSILLPQGSALLPGFSSPRCLGVYNQAPSLFIQLPEYPSAPRSFRGSWVTPSSPHAVAWVTHSPAGLPPSSLGCGWSVLHAQPPSGRAQAEAVAASPEEAQPSLIRSRPSPVPTPSSSSSGLTGPQHAQRGFCTSRESSASFPCRQAGGLSCVRGGSWAECGRERRGEERGFHVGRGAQGGEQGGVASVLRLKRCQSSLCLPGAWEMD